MTDTHYNNNQEVRKMNNKRIIGKAIKNKRIKVGKTQTRVSEDTGISRSYLSDVENGRYMPSVETLIKLASYLELDLNFLLQMTERQDNTKEA